MLNYTYEDILKAFSLNKITERGMEVVEYLKKDFISGAERLKKLNHMRESLSREDQDRMRELEDHLVQMRRKYLIR